MPKCQFLFSAVFVFQKASLEIFSELDETWTEPPIFPTRRRSPEERRRRATWHPHHGATRAPLPRRGVVWGPRASPAAALSPIYSSSQENPRYPSHYPRKVPETPPPSTLAREGSEALPGTLMTHKYRGSQQSSREVKPKFIDSTQGEPKNICKP